MKLTEKFKLINKILLEINMRRKQKYDVLQIVENADWVIKEEGEYLAKNSTKVKVITGISYCFVRNKIIHFGSFNAFISDKKIARPHKSNKVVVTIFHIKPNDKRAERIKQGETDFVDIWHTSCNETKEVMMSLGIPENKIVVIPLHVDKSIFHPIPDYDKKKQREKIGISEDQIVIGSFQKDGEGWEGGNKPKLIKGPDIFCDVVEKLSTKYNIFVLLTGPSRGYVKNRLKNANIPYYHIMLDKAIDVSKYYGLLDLYIVASRVEGGPKAIIESMASGIPLVTTKVGMAPDLVNDGINGMLCNIEDVEQIFMKAAEVIDNKELRKSIIKNATKTSEEYDYKLFPDKLYYNVYSKIK